ncbi:calmodulin-like protein 3 [Platysternon megacephalum]|uniref:Calmodulin-like protein 3 n=1 Tax=Platysternon megacephalum TaxID=55544 RepID=A0A4D9DCV1_9SAUR|nr:calmodulin-like protein 3 [Platysternon megacephalum]
MTRHTLRLAACLIGSVALVSTVVTQAIATTPGPDEHLRVVDGMPATPSDAPFAAYIDRNRGQGWCSGSLVAPQWVLTAAHCNASTVTVTLGHLEYAKGRTVQVTSRQESPNTDVLLLKLDQAVTDIAPVTLATTDPALGSSMTVLGWGKTSPTGQRSPVLRKATMTIAKPRPEKPGQQAPDATDNKGGAALVSDPGSGWIWQGDSGGPALIDGKLVGVASLSSQFSHQAWHSSVATNHAWITKIIKS